MNGWVDRWMLIDYVDSVHSRELKDWVPLEGLGGARVPKGEGSSGPHGRSLPFSTWERRVAFSLLLLLLLLLLLVVCHATRPSRLIPLTHSKMPGGAAGTRCGCPKPQGAANG
jgi:hypothetical protein